MLTPPKFEMHDGVHGLPVVAVLNSELLFSFHCGSLIPDRSLTIAVPFKLFFFL